MEDTRAEEIQGQEYITEEEAKTVKDLFQKNLKSYREKDAAMSDGEWLEQLFRKELPEMPEEEIKKSSSEIVSSIQTFDDNLSSCNEAAKTGTPKENWLAEKMQEASVGMSVDEYGQTLQQMDEFLYNKNMELDTALRRPDGHIMMSPNLDGNIAENMVAKTAEMSAFVEGKNISVEVLESYTANSVDVRAVNHDTGQYQNYQLKFGKDAKATIELLERGNYNNQRIIVPSEQLEEVQAYFQKKGSAKTITDHIDAWGIKGKSFTKEDVKSIQEYAQQSDTAPVMDYSHYQTKDLAVNIGKNAGAMALQSMAVTTGLNIASKVFKGEPVDADELVEIAVKTGADTSVKVVTAGTLKVAIQKGIIRFIPKATPAGIIANIACVGIENVKVLAKIASGDLSVTKGLDQMGRVSTSMVGGLFAMGKGAIMGAKLTGWIPVVGPALAVATGFIGGMVGYFGGSKLGEAVYNAGRKVAGAAKTVAKAAFNGLKSFGRAVAGRVKSGRKGILRRIISAF